MLFIFIFWRYTKTQIITLGGKFFWQSSKYFLAFHPRSASPKLYPRSIKPKKSLFGSWFNRPLFCVRWEILAADLRPQNRTLNPSNTRNLCLETDLVVLYFVFDHFNFVGWEDFAAGLYPLLKILCFGFNRSGL